MNHLSPSDIAQLAQWAIIAAGCVSLIGAIFWVTWVIRQYRQELKRTREGLCMHCGYDLRQSKDRCPECGQPILFRK
jgi:DNA-directed RNA polymerase subunit RPC12/RpoP